MNIRFNDGEGVDDFTLRLQNIVATLETVRETIPPRRVVEKLIRVVPKSLWHRDGDAWLRWGRPTPMDFYKISANHCSVLLLKSKDPGRK